jgi:hypothetical protein
MPRFNSRWLVSESPCVLVLRDLVTAYDLQSGLILFR